MGEFKRAKFAVVGVDRDGEAGVLSHQEDIVSAYRDARQIRKSGGVCRVFPVMDGKFTDTVISTIMKMFRQILRS